MVFRLRLSTGLDFHDMTIVRQVVVLYMDDRAASAFTLPRAKLELCQKIQKHIPEFVFSESQIGEDPDKRNYIVSNRRIEATGWKPIYTLDDGIAELIKAYRIAKQRQYGNF